MDGYPYLSLFIQFGLVLSLSPVVLKKQLFIIIQNEQKERIKKHEKLFKNTKQWTTHRLLTKRLLRGYYTTYGILWAQITCLYREISCYGPLPDVTDTDADF